MRRPWLLAAALAAAAVAVAVIALVRDNSSAAASPPGFPNNPPGRKPMIFDIGSMIYGTDQQRSQALATVKALGGDALRVPVLWNVLAPAKRPAGFQAASPSEDRYNWAPYDATLREAQKQGLEVLLMPTGPAPSWASRAGSKGLQPDPSQFGLLVSALAQRYNGRFDPDKRGGKPPLPKVGIWTVWNEPNLSLFLQPQARGGKPYSPLLYRRLYLQAQSAIHDAQPNAPILIGETAPTGGTDSTDPLTFVRETLCLDDQYKPLPGCPDPDAKVDAVGWSTHPYPLAGQDPQQPVTNPNFVTMSSLGSLESTLDNASNAGAIPDQLPIYITEFGVQSHPDPNAVSLRRQAADIGIAENIAYGDGRIATFAQYLLNDDSPDAVAGQKFGGFESGLRFFDGRDKPAFDAFRLPLAIQKLGNTVSLWGIVQPYPHPTTVTIRFRNPGGGIKALQTVSTDGAGIYTTTYGDTPGREWQAVWHSPVDGRTYHSTWTGSYEYAAPPTG
jgi:hypothetical protein